MKLKAYCENRQELQKLAKILGPYIKSIKQTKQGNSEHLKASIKLKDLV